MRCKDCRWYPWVPEADPSMLPAHRCHPSLPFKRWTPYSAEQERHCSFFEPVQKPVEAKPDTKEKRSTTKKKDGGSK
ncbi:MAG: hypothetical protein HPY70_12685 [Firmicutes bacterium]|nr:hypothetical protein [Bacillota bacterium]